MNVRLSLSKSVIKVLRTSLKTLILITSTLFLLHPDRYRKRRVRGVFRDALNQELCFDRLNKTEFLEMPSSKISQYYFLISFKSSR